MKKLVIKAHFDGERIVLPKELEGHQPRDLFLFFHANEEELAWRLAGEEALAKVWDDEQDADYDIKPS